MNKLSKKLLFLSVFLFFSIFLIKPSSVLANPQDVFKANFEQLKDAELQAKQEAGDDGVTRITGQFVTDYSTGATMYSMIKTIGCPDLKLCPDLLDNISTESGLKKPDNALSGIGMLMANLYSHPPASGLAYTQDLLANAGLIAKPAYAQGVGFAGLTPFLPLWKGMRDIAYMVLIIVMIAIGFMIIFRVKIDPKTIISVQAAIPKIILSLVLITFSYPIVGFMIDLMYLVMAISIYVIAGAFPWKSTDVVQLQQTYINANIATLFGQVFLGGISTFDDFAKLFLPGLGASGIGSAIGAVVTMGTGFMGPIIGAIAPILLIMLILFLGLLYTFFRLLLLLINSYIQLVINLIIAPFILLAEAIPGKSTFGSWILNIIANLVVFPATAIILIFALILTTAGGEGPIWMPPLIGWGGRQAFNAILGISVIFISPTLVAKIKKAFHPKPVLPITAGTALAPLTGGAQTAMGAASQFYYMKNLPGIEGIMKKIGLAK